MKSTYLVNLNCYGTTNNFFRGNKKKRLKTRYAYIINQVQGSTERTSVQSFNSEDLSKKDQGLMFTLSY